MFFMANYRTGARRVANQWICPLTMVDDAGGEIERYDAKSRGNKWHQVVHRESSVDEKRQLKRKFLLFIALKIHVMFFLWKFISSRSINSTNYILFCFLNYKQKAYLAEAWPENFYVVSSFMVYFLSFLFITVL